MINLEEILSGCRTAAITGHIRPDGDCVGSTLGMYNYICDNFPDIKVHIYLEQPGNEFSFMKNFDKIKTSVEECDKEYDIFFVFDCGDEGRFAPFSRLLDISKKSICIDHHVANSGFADISMVIPDLSSTCELLYTCMEDEKISRQTAECLYTGIICDTGIFKYQSTTSETMRIAGKLMDKGINHTRIIDEGFFMKSYEQNLITGRALLNSRLICDGKCIYSYVNMETMKEYGLDGKKLGGVIDQLRNTSGTEAAVFLYEVSDGEYKVSMRSRDYVDVSEICRMFGGGGHVKAAGCNIKGSVSQIIDLISGQLMIQFDKYGD